MAQSTYPLTGIQTGLGPQNDPLRRLPLRREIDEWWASNNPDDINQKSLFINALDAFQRIDPNNMLSYFQIAGIHGQPLTSWDEPSKPGFGYCVHGTPIFATWHRPYILLYEQRLYEIMTQQVIPNQFDQSQWDELRRAADNWRLPYWDWAMQKPDWHDPSNPSKYGPNVPKILTLQQVEIRTRTGAQIVDNPMWRFKLPQPDQSKTATMGDYGITALGDEHFEDCQATVKQADTDQPGDPDYVADFIQGDEQNVDPITANLRGPLDQWTNTLPEAVYRLMVLDYLPTYDSFASSQYVGGQASNYASLEGIHNSIHTWVGGIGHMSNIPVAAFDPIFWLHHNNVERLACIWQDLHPGDSPSYWLDVNDPPAFPDPDDPLHPFHSDTNGTLYTSNLVRDWRPLGYTFPELQNWLPQYQTNGQFDSTKYVTAVKAMMDKSYSTTANAVLALPNHRAIAPARLPALGMKVRKLVQHITERASGEKTVGTGPAAATEQKPIVAPLAADKAAAPPPSHHEPSGPAAPPSVPAQHASQWEENDYVVNVQYEKFALQGTPFNIRLFLGATHSTSPSESYNYMHTPTQIGNVFNFASPPNLMGRDSSGCANCQRQELNHTRMAGQVILTDRLVELVKREIPRGGIVLQSLARQDVVPFLRHNLNWIVTDMRDRPIAIESIPSLKVSVAGGRATHFAAHELLSEYRDYEVIYDITQGRPGGAGVGDDV